MTSDLTITSVDAFVMRSPNIRTYLAVPRQRFAAAASAFGQAILVAGLWRTPTSRRNEARAYASVL